MKIPIYNRLKKQGHKDVAIAQDLLLIEIYNSFPDAVIHGGTAIWRVYGGNRFSEDIDVYLPEKYKKSDKTKEFIISLRNKGFTVNKFRERESSIYSTFTYQNTIVRFEVVFLNKANYVLKPFEMSDGTYINVYTLSPEDIISEKVAAYKKRKKIRDLYDIFFLLRLIEDKGKVIKDIVKLLEDFKKPLDTEDLKVLIISGAIPKLEDILGEIRKWVK